MNYKYTTIFEAPIEACRINESSFISKASLDNLHSLVPQDINFEENIDLIGVAFNAAVVNKFNKNGDGMDTDTAIAFTKNFLHKPTNIEHNKEKIVGHIASVGFSKYGSSEILTPEEVSGKDDMFNIALGAVVYRSANKAFADLLERSTDPNDSYYQKISTSWEVGFTDYVLALGSSDLKYAEIVSDEKSIEGLKKHLRVYGGSGRTEDGRNIYRLITGKIYPAADVKGVFKSQEKESLVKINDKRDKNTNKISQSENINVKNKNKFIMDIEKMISELKDLLIEKKFSEETVASMTNTFADAIREKDEQYRQDIESVKSEKEAIAKEHSELKESVEALHNQLTEAQEKINSFEATQKAEQAIARFNERMDLIDQEYSLEDEDRGFLAKELKNLGLEEESFASFKEKLSVLWRDKNKEVKAAFEAQIQARIDAEVEKRLTKVSVASSTDPEESDKEASTEEILDNVETSEAGIANSNETTSRESVSLRDKFAAAFNRENITIS
jgi:hypothetical protein